MTPAPARRRRIAVVDDDVAAACAVTLVLDEDYDPQPFGGARELINALKGGVRFDLILLDIVMPEMDGVELLKLLEKAEPEQASRVIFITALLEGELPPEAAGRVLFKPFEVPTLLRFVTLRLARLAS